MSTFYVVGGRTFHRTVAVHGEFATREQADVAATWIRDRYRGSVDPQILTEWPANGEKWIIRDMPTVNNLLLDEVIK